MGYEVAIVNANVFVPHNRLDEAYRALVDLNRPESRAEKRRDNPMSPSSVARPEDSTSVNPDPSQHLPWLDWNYDEVCSTAEQILAAYGFTLEFSNDGDLIDLSYDGKTGCEEDLLSAIAPCVKAGSAILWEDEDGGRYRYDFDGRSMTITYDDFSPNFGLL